MDALSYNLPSTAGMSCRWSWRCAASSRNCFFERDLQACPRSSCFEAVQCFDLSRPLLRGTWSFIWRKYWKLKTVGSKVNNTFTRISFILDIESESLMNAQSARFRTSQKTDSDRYTNGWLPIRYHQKQGMRFAGVSQGHEILVPEIVIAILLPPLLRRGWCSRGKRSSGEMFSH